MPGDFPNQPVSTTLVAKESLDYCAKVMRQKVIECMCINYFDVKDKSPDYKQFTCRLWIHQNTWWSGNACLFLSQISELTKHKVTFLVGVNSEVHVLVFDWPIRVFPKTAFISTRDSLKTTIHIEDTE